MVERDKFNFSTEVRVRLPETDAFGIVFHANFFVYFDVARVGYLRNIDAMRFLSPEFGNRSALVHADADFQSPARFDDELVIHGRISAIGRSSIKFEFRAIHKKENRTVATGVTTVVVLHPDTWKPKPVPEEFRELIRKFEGQNLEERKA